MNALPESFGIVTAWNPDGISADVASNQIASARLQSMLQAEALPCFPVTGGSADFAHVEPGFGIIADQSRIVEFGRRFRQEAVFWINRGAVQLCPCNDAPTQIIGTWNELATAAAAQPAFHFRGPLTLLAAPATAFFCSTQCPGEQVLAAYSWARQQCDERGTVISGFHSPIEQDVLAILARRDARILWVPARDLPQKLPASLTVAREENRLFILTPFDYGKPSRSDKATCHQRNRFVLNRSAAVYVPHCADNSALSKLLGEGKPAQS
ncbi:hypothetical protein BH11VER1_BH11VER1_01920 [soil metagenome]